MATNTVSPRAELAEQSAMLDRQIVRARKKLQLLQWEQGRIAREVQSLRRLRSEMIDSLKQTMAVYSRLEKELREMANLVPFTDDERSYLENSINQLR